MTASVVSGAISDTEPTNVVLPTPKPPATTIFTEVVVAAFASGRAAVLEPAKSTEHPFEQRQVRLPILVSGLMHTYQPIVGHVTDQDPGHPERHPQVRRNLSHRSDLLA
jgi:hypothetical protein